MPICTVSVIEMVPQIERTFPWLQQGSNIFFLFHDKYDVFHYLLGYAGISNILQQYEPKLFVERSIIPKAWKLYIIIKIFLASYYSYTKDFFSWQLRLIDDQ